ncbi:hypothetical protein MINS_32870 [Mycolicibacterium insubricum]|uniref:Uncharacterized protein n=1 Tax=Mycolicibacterium insubricum TaxID=444597 RepID=A0A1X0DNZ6_9MYCO|nr:hypothetical protein [Mycolicibacterium insubricum]MCV7083264.1 hypothetical protein [Mycolicibacterium insubricum]ORA74108.1 hypothetical protein BST26_00560 [Mycolicibacterium insubricum]BBZ67858.1 hypothetical protein MINS_32870 [Mycolicibacterium insubricum]
MGTRVGRLVAAAAVLTAVAGSAIAAIPAPTVSHEAGPKCLAWIGARGTGKCIGYSMSNSGGISAGTPGIGVGNGGVQSGPMLPGTSVSGSIPVG